MLGSVEQESSLTEKNTGVPGEHQIEHSLLFNAGLSVYNNLGCTSQGIASTSREVMPYSALLRPHLEVVCSCSGSPSTRNTWRYWTEASEWIQR